MIRSGASERLIRPSALFLVVAIVLRCLCGVRKIISIWLIVCQFLKSDYSPKKVFRFLLHFALPSTEAKNAVCEFYETENILLPIFLSLYTMHVYFYIIWEAPNNHTVLKGVIVPHKDF